MTFLQSKIKFSLTTTSEQLSVYNASAERMILPADDCNLGVLFGLESLRVFK